MASIPIELSEEQLELLRQRAAREDTSPEEYLHRLIQRELTPRAEQLRRATEHVLMTNHELYKRLS